MAGFVIHDFQLFVASILVGFLYSFFYDQLLVRRAVIPLSAKINYMEDIAYAIKIFFISLYLLTYGNYGILRGYMLLGVGTGCFLYSKTIGKVYRRMICQLIRLLMLPFTTFKKALTGLLNQITIKVKRASEQKGEKKNAKTQKVKTKVSSDEK